MFWNEEKRRREIRSILHKNNKILTLLNTSVAYCEYLQMNNVSRKNNYGIYKVFHIFFLNYKILKIFQ